MDPPHCSWGHPLSPYIPLAPLRYPARCAGLGASAVDARVEGRVDVELPAPASSRTSVVMEAAVALGRVQGGERGGQGGGEEAAGARVEGAVQHGGGSERGGQCSARREGGRCSCEGEECVSVEGWAQLQLPLHARYPVRHGGRGVAVRGRQAWSAMGVYDGTVRV